jgi:hypothetical protein
MAENEFFSKLLDFRGMADNDAENSKKTGPFMTLLYPLNF